MMQSLNIILLICASGYPSGLPPRPAVSHEPETGLLQLKGVTMSGAQDDAARGAEGKQTAGLERARTAARRFCVHFQFPQESINRLDGDPIQKPLIIERNGSQVEVFRWLGHGRGASYVQVELDTKTHEITVYGALKDREFGPWKP